MSIKPSHVGEPLIEALAKADLDGFYAKCGLTRVPGVDWEVASELKLSRWGGREFDPLSRVDLGIRVGESSVTPVEIKLGLEGLGCKAVDVLLNSWDRSRHTDPRWKGSMMAFLDRRHPVIDYPTGEVPGELRVLAGKTTLTLTKDWIVIARRKVIQNWNVSMPGFQNARFVIFEDLADSLGEGRFNSMVSTLLPINFYQAWVNTTKSLRR